MLVECPACKDSLSLRDPATCGLCIEHTRIPAALAAAYRLVGSGKQHDARDYIIECALRLQYGLSLPPKHRTDYQAVLRTEGAAGVLYVAETFGTRSLP